jgi:hypothetical protein
MIFDSMPELGGPHFDRGMIGANGRLLRLHKGGAENERDFKDLFARAIVAGKQSNGKRATPQQQRRALVSLGVNPAQYMTAATLPPAKPVAASQETAPVAAVSSDTAKRKRGGASLLTAPSYAGSRRMGGNKTLLG